MQSDLVQHRLRPCGVIVGKRPGPRWIVELRSRGNGELLRRCQPVERELVDLLTVDGQRHGVAEALVEEDLPLRRILMIEVEHVDHPRRLEILPLAQRVVADRLVLLVEREVRRIGEPASQIHAALHHAENGDLALREVAHGEIVDIGQLVARGVHGPKVGIAHPGDAFRVAIGHIPRAHLRLDVLAPWIEVEPIVEVLDPVIIPFGCCQLLGIRIEFWMELLEEMHRSVEATLARARIRHEDAQLRLGEGDRKGDAQRVVVDGLELGKLAAQGELAAVEIP